MSHAPHQPLGPFKWWIKKQWVYNLALAAAGIGAYACYLFAINLFRPDLANDPDFDPGGAAIILQAVGYACMMFVANVCYLIFGPCLESLIEPNDPDTHREILFLVGTFFSCALPFVIPLLVAIGG